MAGNYGKYKDRSPVICAAGVLSGDPTETVAGALKQYPIVDKIESLRHDAKIWKEDEFVLPRKLPPIQNAHFKGTNTEVSEAMRPPVLTRFQQLILDLKETPYQSYWNAETGKVRDAVPGLPPGMDKVNTTFGDPTKRDITLKEIVNPSKGPYEVLRESQIGHELYKKSHNDYNPSEKIERGYVKPPYDPKTCFGGKSKYDPRGLGTRCAVDWYKKEPIAHAHKIQADFLKRTRSVVGEVLAPNNNIKCVPKDHVFGDPSNQQFYGVEELLKDPNVTPSIFRRDMYEWLSTLNKTRIWLKKKCVQGLKVEDFYKKALYFDKEKTGLLPLKDLYEIFACYHLSLPKDLEYLCDYLNYIVDGKVNYRKYIDMIDINKEVTDIKLLNDIPDKSKYYISTSQAASCDYLFINNNALPPAGIPSVRHDLTRPTVPEGQCRADLENLGNETSAKACLNPSIYTNYGLTYRDFFVPRSPETIRTLFEKLGYNFPGDNFQKLWEMGLKQDQTGSVCVETFKKLLESQCRSLKLRVDEKQIECEKGIS